MNKRDCTFLRAVELLLYTETVHSSGIPQYYCPTSASNVVVITKLSLSQIETTIMVTVVNTWFRIGTIILIDKIE